MTPDLYELEDILIAETVESIGRDVVGATSTVKNRKLKTVELPGNLKTIGKCAFEGSSIESITLPDKITSIGDYAFAYCRNLKSIKLPSGLKTIGESAFSDTKLVDVKIPASVRELANSCFDGCQSLKTLYFYGPLDMYHIPAPDLNRIGLTVYYPYNISAWKDYVSHEEDNYRRRREYGDNDFEPHTWIPWDPSKGFMDISKLKTSLSRSTFTYNGDVKKPAVTIKNGSYTLKENTDFKVSYKSNRNAGTAQAIVEGTGLYEGKATLEFKIYKKDISQLSPVLSSSGYTYDRNAKEPSVRIQYGNLTLAQGTDYTVEYTDNRNAGTGKVTITGKGNYKGTVIKEITIDRKDVKDLSLSLSAIKYTYSGNAKKPKVTLKHGETVLKQGTEYKVTYKNNVNAGKGIVTVTGLGNYKGSVSKEITINPKSISSCSVELADDTLTWNGEARKPGVSVTDGNRTLRSGTDFSVSYADNTAPGTASVTVTGTGNYKGSLSDTFTIVKKNLASCTVTLSKTSFTYNGKEQKPVVTVKDGTTALKEGINYSLTFTNNVNAGTASVKITGRGKYYTGTVKKTYKINKAPQTITVVPESIGLNVGQKTTLKAEGKGTITWNADDETIAIIDESGKVTAVSEGSTEILIKASGDDNYKAASITVRVMVTNIGKPAVTGLYNSSKGADIRWSPAKGAEGYAVYRFRSSEGKTLAGTVDGTNTCQFYDTAVKDNCWGCVYTYTVAAMVDGVPILSTESGGKILQRLAPMKITGVLVTGTGTATVKWEASAGSNKAEGYELQYAQSSADLNGRKGTYKTITISGRNSLSKVIKSLTKGKKYYFRVRAYVNYTNSATGKTTKTWSQYSNVVNVKITK